MKQDNPKSKKKPVPYAKRKKAFDDVMAAYRDCQVVPLSAIQYADGLGGTRYAAKPTLTDFKCDVERVIKKCVGDIPRSCREGDLFWTAAAANVRRFFMAYVLMTPDDPIEREVYADKMIGEGRHNLEQGMGSLFIQRHLYPTKGKGGYFTTIRRKTNAE